MYSSHASFWMFVCLDTIHLWASKETRIVNCYPAVHPSLHCPPEPLPCQNRRFAPCAAWVWRKDSTSLGLGSPWLSLAISGNGAPAGHSGVWPGYPWESGLRPWVSTLCSSFHLPFLCQQFVTWLNRDLRVSFFRIPSLFPYLYAP